MSGQTDNGEERNLVSDVSTELALISAQRNLAAFSDLELPTLATLAASATLRDRQGQPSSASIGKHSSVQDLLDAAIPKMPTAANKQAAALMVGSGDLRWTNQGERRHAAGRTREITGETFRKNHETGVLAELAATIVHRFPPTEPPPEPKPDSNTKRLAAAALGIILLGALVFAAINRGESDEVTTTPSSSTSTTVLETTAPPTSTETSTTATTAAAQLTEEYIPSGQLDVTLYCTEQLGEGAAAEVIGSNPTDWTCRNGDQTEAVDFNLACETAYGPATQASNEGSGPYTWTCIAPTVLSTPGECAITPGQYDADFQYDLGPYAQGFTDAGKPLTELGLCPTTVVHRAGEGVRQEFHDPTEPDQSLAAVLTRTPDSDYVTLSDATWSAFKQVAGLEAGLVGYPLNTATVQSDGSWWVPFSVGGGLVSTAEAGPFQWMPAVAHEKWKSLGALDSCLREPVSNPYPVTEGFQQDFAGGNLLLNFTTGDLTARGTDC